MGAGRMIQWLSIAGLDAVGRLAIQIIATAVLARLLVPEAFGVAALVTSVIGLIAMIAGGVPFEEALVQRRGLKRGHFQSALAVSFLASAVFTLLIFLFAGHIGDAFDAPEIGPLMMASSSVLFASAVFVMLVAYARRRRRFNDIAQANIAGHGIGAAVGVALALAGAGVWAIVAIRIVQPFVSAAVLVLRLKIFFLPRFQRDRFREIFAFARITLLERFIENGNYLLFNYAVGAMFGLAALGHLNMAMRIIEPIRGAFNSIAHNLAYPSLMGASREPGRLGPAANDATLVTTTLAAPAFLGIAAVSPTLIPILAGPGWEDAVTISILIACGCALMGSVQMVYTSTQVIGRPDVNLMRRLVGLSSAMLALIAAAPLGALAAGVARMMGDVAEALWSTGRPRRRIGAALPDFAAAAGPSTLAAVCMGLFVFWLGGWPTAEEASLLALLGLVAAGAVSYAVFLALLAPRHLRAALSWARLPTPGSLTP